MLFKIKENIIWVKYIYINIFTVLIFKILCLSAGSYFPWVAISYF